MIKHYVISSTVFKTKTGAEEKIREWEYEGSLDNGTKIYEVTENTKVFVPALKLEEEK